MNKIRDVEYAFFAQLAYLNWNNLELSKLKNLKEYKDKNFIEFFRLSEQVWEKIKLSNIKEPVVSNEVLMYDENDKRLFGVFGTEYDTNKKYELKPLYDFNGWQFIYSADNIKLFKERYDLEVENNGFFACAFMKDNDIVIAYRGTEPDTIEDIIADLEIGFLNHSHSQLVCAYLFLEHVHSLYPDKNINITGHSLGGCLAQYAFVCTGKKYPTVTWNALGVGKHKNEVTENLFWGNDITKYLKVYSYDTKKKLENLLLPNGKIIDDFLKLTEDEMIDKIFREIYTPTKENIETGYYKIAEKEIGGVKVAFGTMPSSHNRENQNLSLEHDKELRNELKISSIQIYWLLKGIKNYQLCFKVLSNQIRNFYNSLDWTALLQTREGETVDVLTGNECPQENTDDTKWKIIKETFNKLGFLYHGVNDFLIYMNKDGKIIPGIFNETFTKNAMKTIYCKILQDDSKRKEDSKKLTFIKKGTRNKTEEEKPFNQFHLTCTKIQPFGKKQTEVELSSIKYKIPAKASLSNNLSSYVEYREFSQEEKNGSDELGIFLIGELCNVNLCGIKGEKTVELIKIKKSKSEKLLEEEKIASSNGIKISNGSVRERVGYIVESYGKDMNRMV